jgi:hypothetical protein
MSLILPTKREFIKNLFIAPAIVSAVNLMPVKAYAAFEAVTGADAFETVTGATWELVKSGERLLWMPTKLKEMFKYDVTSISKFDLPESHRLNATMETVSLMKVHNATVVHELPGHMIRTRIVSV